MTGKTRFHPILVFRPPPSIKGRRVLVVDETCDYAPESHAFMTDNSIILP